MIYTWATAFLSFNLVFFVGCTNSGATGNSPLNGVNSGNSATWGKLLISKNTAAMIYDFGSGTSQNSNTDIDSLSKLHFNGSKISDLRYAGAKTDPRFYLGTYKLDGLALVPGGHTTTVFEPGSFSPMGPPILSPDGTRIGMVVSENLGVNDYQPVFYIFNTSGQRLVRAERVRNPVWVDNSQILVSADDGIYLIAPTSSSLVGNVAQLAGAVAGTRAEDLSLSPDKKAIAFTINNSIYRINIDGTKFMRLTASYSGRGYPVWSPDGSSILFQLRDCYGVSPGETLQTTSQVVRILSDVPNQNVSNANYIPDTTYGVLRGCGPYYFLY